ncbi:MAG: elongation factor 4, partial [bacterium]|nr:elongation factor 4 [bacterium]
AIVERIPSPLATNQLASGNLRALVFDSFYDEHKGVVAVIKVASGQVSVARGEKLKFFQSQMEFEALEVGCFSPDIEVLTELSSGEVGYVATGFKDVAQVRSGDTLLLAGDVTTKPLPGYREPKPMVFAGLYPIENDEYLKLRQALGKLHLTDSSFTYTPESSPALGNGFRGGFLGLLHAEVVQERLEREFDLSLISTTPNVVYEASLTSGKELTVNSAAELPDPTQVKEIREPWVKLVTYSPSEYIGAVMKLAEEKRAIYKEMNYLGSSQTVRINYEMPLAEMMVDFFDRLKSISAGYASLDWEFIDFRPAEAVRLDIYVHQELVEPLSQIVIKAKAERVGRQLVLKLKEVIPSQQFPVAIQAAIGGKIIARETVSGVRKDVLAKMSGGHRERKDKLLEAQKKGKKRMKMFGKVAIPQEAFRTVLSSG